MPQLGTAGMKGSLGNLDKCKMKKLMGIFILIALLTGALAGCTGTFEEN